MNAIGISCKESMIMPTNHGTMPHALWQSIRGDASCVQACIPAIDQSAARIAASNVRRFIVKPSTSTIALALTTAIGATGIVHATGNPFALNTLSQGYRVSAADKTKDGKCGEGKCGAKKEAKLQDVNGATIKDGRAKDGKCGEGKCGSRK
jgi:uncharacterized low-complexity protein